MFAALLLGLTVLGVWRAWERKPLSVRVTAVALVIWALALVFMTMRPASGMLRLNLIPVIMSGTASAFDTLANIAVFVPLGLLLAAAGLRILPTVALGLGVSLAIEITQYMLDVGRTADINDLVTNTSGAAVGWATAAALRACRRRTARRTAGS